MLFENPQINLSELPSVEEVQYEPISKDLRTVSIIGNAILFTVLLLIFLLINFANDNLTETPSLGWIGLLVYGILMSIAIFLVIKGHQVKGFALREKDILFRRGYIFRSEIAVPFNRVQHCEIKRGLIERSYNLSSLKIFTAGGAASDLTIPGLLKDQAQTLKEYIMNEAGKESSDLTPTPLQNPNRHDEEE